VGRLLLNYVLSDPFVDVALVGMRGPRPRGTRFVELNNEISDNVTARIDGCEAHLGAARSVCPLRRFVGVVTSRNRLMCTVSQSGGSSLAALVPCPVYRTLRVCG
jgi:hypothetical protein